jgi:hypothetical protein
MSGPSATTSTKPHNRNPTGRNQYKDCRTYLLFLLLISPSPSAAPKNDNQVTELLYDYQRREIFDKKKISQLLYDEHGIKLRYACYALFFILISNDVIQWELGSSQTKSSGSLCKWCDHPTAARDGQTTARAHPDVERSGEEARPSDDQTADCSWHRYSSDKVYEDQITPLIPLSWRWYRDYIRGEMMRQDPEGFASRDTSVRKTNMLEISDGESMIHTMTVLPTCWHTQALTGSTCLNILFKPCLTNFQWMYNNQPSRPNLVKALMILGCRCTTAVAIRSVSLLAVPSLVSGMLLASPRIDRFNQVVRSHCKKKQWWQKSESVQEPEMLESIHTSLHWISR